MACLGAVWAAGSGRGGGGGAGGVGVRGSPRVRVVARWGGLGGRAGGVGRDRAVVDDAAAAGGLVLHDPERLLGAQEGPREGGVDHGPPPPGRGTPAWGGGGGPWGGCRPRPGAAGP